MKQNGFKCVVAALMVNGAIGWSSEIPVYHAVKAEEVRARDGIGNVMKKIRSGEEVTVAYLGGSITAMNGWRNKTTEWLRTTYPTASFKEIHAAIGGTGAIWVFFA